MRHCPQQGRPRTADAHEAKRRVTQSEEAGGTVPFTFDAGLLADDTADPEVREREWMRVYTHFDPRLRDYFAARVPDRDELDDLLATLWRRALRGLPDLRYPGSAWNWLVRVGLNALRDGWRRESVRAERLDRWLNEQSAEGEPLVETVLEDDDDADDTKLNAAQPLDRGAVLSALERLPPNDQAVLRLRLFEELDHADIAVRLGLPSAAAARQRFSRARVQLQRMLTAERTTDRSSEASQREKDTLKVAAPRPRSQRGHNDV